MPPLSRRAVAVSIAALPAVGASRAAAQAAAPGDITIGSAKAKVHVVAYLSLTCPHCADYNRTVFPVLKAKYVDTGRVRYTVRELLTAPAQVAAAGFLMARCAGPSKYHAVVDAVFKSQSRWQGGSIKPIFLEIAKAQGLTEAQFEACLVDTKGQEALTARLEYATRVDKVTGTPTFIVNGETLPHSHDGELAQLEAAIARAERGR